MSYRLLRFICVTMILLQFFAIHVSQSRSALAQSGGVAQVSLTNNGFDPATLTIVLGTQVRWTNQTGASYTLSTGNLEDRSMVYLPIIQAWSRAARATAATTLFPQDNGDKFSVTLLPAQSYGHTFTQVGKYPYQAGSFKGTIIVTEPTQLVLFHIGDSTLPLGNTLSIQLRAYDPGGASITFAVGPLPLPANMTLDSNTGAFVFRPNASQAGPVTLTFQALTGAGAVATEQVTIQVTGPGGIEQTGVRGRILDANAIARGEIKPLVGATVTHLGSGRSVTTDSNGYFALIGLPPGVNHFDYNGATATPINTYGGYRAKLTLLAGVTHEIERPLYIMQIDKAAETQVDPTDTTVVRNPSLNIDLTIPAHTVMDDNDTEYAGNISVSQVPVGFTPAALPATMAPALVVTIQPMGLTFDQPAPITFENIMGLKPGENVNIWSMDHASGQFFVAGIGQVSADGARIETIQGGIRESSWHFPLPPPPPVADTPDQDSDNSNHPDKCECTTSSTTSMREGTLTTDFSLPAYRTLGAARSLTFVYASAHAYPYKTIPLDVSTDPDSYPGTGSEDLIMPIADLFSYNLTVGGVTQGKETFFTAPTSSVVRIAPSFTAAAFQTGVYPYVVNIQGAFLGASPLLPSARVSAARVGHTIVVNEQNSPLGAGWGIAGLQRLYVQPDKTGLIVDGSGATQRFAIGLAGTPRQPLPAAKGALVAATMADGIHVVGGADSWSGAGVTTTHVVFDPTTNDWGTRAPVPDNNMWGAVGAVVAGKLYLFGGWSSGDILTRVYDPATDTWAPRADIPAPGFNYGHTAAVVNNQVYVVGGTNGNHLFRYDPATNSWATDLAAIPTNQATLAADVIAGEIYVVGVGAQLQIYNPAANTWRQGAPLPIATLRPSVAAVNNKLYLFGGSTDDLGGDIRAIQVYDPATDTWEQRLELSGARSWSAAAVYNNDVYVVGGFNQENSATALNEFVTLTATSAPRWYGPDGDYSTLQLLADGTAVRYFADGTQSRFNVNGLQTAAVDRNGKATTYFYDAQDRLLTITDPVGQVTTLTYGGNRLQTVVDPVGRTTSFTHDAAGNLIKVTFPDGSTRAFGYDPRHLMTSESDPLGKTTTRTFDWAGRMDSATLPDASLRKVTSVQGAGAVDPALGLGTVNEPIIAVPAPTVNTLVNGEGLTTTITTGRFGEATLIIGPDGLSTTMERDNQGNATIVRLPSGAEFQMTYDSQGNVANFTDLAVGGATHYQYEPIFNQVTTIVDPQGHTTNVAYDSAGNPKKIETTLGQTVVFTYNAQALPSQIQDVLGAITTFAYDSKGNPIALTRTAGNEQRQYNMAYTAEGYLQSITDGQGRTVNQTYDAAGRITAQVLPDGNQLNYTYDAAGQVTTITPPGRLAHTFAYNDLGLVVAYTPPSVSNGGPTTYQYNRTQQITRIALPGSQLVDFHYDTAGRLARMTQPRGETSYHYDNLTGNLLEIQAPQGVNLAYQYSYGGRVANVAWSGPVAGTLYRTYDSSGRIFSLSVNQEAPFYYSYNGNGLPVYAGGLSLTYDDPRGLLTNTTLGYVQENYSHNGFGEVTTYQVQSWDLNSAMMVDRYQAHYIRNNLGWITKQTETISGTTTVYDYTYDLAGRLSTIKKDGLTATTYTYDSNGNRLSDGARTATYDAQDRLLQYGDTVYTYTPNGDLLTKMRNGQTTTYGYDALNNLMNVTLPDGRKIDYLVDGNNRRVGKMVGGTLVQGFLYIDTLNPMAELDGNNNIVSQFVYATRPNVPDFMIKNGSTYRLILDHLGSPRLVIDHNTGQIMQQLAYDAFGNVLLDTNPGFQPFGFAGGLYDRDTKLVRFGARDYDAEVGRWTMKDPILFEGDETNLYGYASNNPINFQDVTGTRLIKGGPKPWKPASSACSLAAEIVNKGLDTIPTLKTIPAKKELLKGACEIGQAIREEIDKEKIEAFDSCMKGGNDPFTCHDIATGARPKLDHNWQEREEARKTVRRQYDELMRKIGQPQDSVEDTCRP